MVDKIEWETTEQQEFYEWLIAHIVAIEAITSDQDLIDKAKKWRLNDSDKALLASSMLGYLVKNDAWREWLGQYQHNVINWSESYLRLKICIDIIKETIPWTVIPFEKDFYKYINEIIEGITSFKTVLEKILNNK